MKPIWLIVEYASSFFMSGCVSETKPPYRAVVAPTIAITIIMLGASSTRGLSRTSRNGPAFTIVAA